MTDSADITVSQGLRAPAHAVLGIPDHPCSGDDCSQILLVSEVAAILRVPSSWVYQHQSDLPVFKLGRYLRCTCGELTRYIKGQTCK